MCYFMGFSFSIGSCFMVSGTETMLELSTVFFQCTILLSLERNIERLSFTHQNTCSASSTVTWAEIYLV